MTAVTDDWVQRLVTLAIDCRPTGAPRWDAQGIAAAIRKVQHLALADVAHAVIRAADDRSLQTPAPIGIPGSSCWRERSTERIGTATPPRREEACVECNKRVELCICGARKTRPDAPAPAERTRHYLGVIRASIRTQEEA